MKDFFKELSTQKFNDTDFRILDFFMQHASQIPTMTLRQVAQQLFVSDVTVIRFCKKIGLKGFNELKFRLKNQTFHETTSVFDLRHQVDQEIKEFHQFAENIDMETIEKIVSFFCGNDYIYIHGKNLCINPAKYLQIVLTTMNRRCILIDTMEFMDTISRTIQKNALLILISDGDGNEYLEIVQQAKANSSVILFIGDDDCKILYPYIDYLLSNRKLSTIHHSQISSFILVQLLIEEFTRQQAQQKNL